MVYFIKHRWTFAGNVIDVYADMTEDTLAGVLMKISCLMVADLQAISDVRPGRGDEKWLNIILRKI